MLIKTGCMMLLLAAVGCASVSEGYTARYGLTNPESPSAYRNLTDEAPSSGVVGDQYVEEYEKKYREKDILRVPMEAAPEGEGTRP